MIILAGQSVDAGQSQLSGGDAVAAVCCCRCAWLTLIHIRKRTATEALVATLASVGRTNAVGACWPVAGVSRASLLDHRRCGLSWPNSANTKSCL
jgi:hypothetical protein